MTDFLTIATLIIPVEEGQVSQGYDRGGSRYRAYAGNLRATTRFEKSVWKVQTAEMLQVDMAALVAACALSAVVVVNGNITGSVATNCIVDVNELPYLTAATGDGLGYMRRATLVIQQV